MLALRSRDRRSFLAATDDPMLRVCSGTARAGGKGELEETGGVL